MLVSIIIPSFNKEKYITETVLSVINQSYTNWELLIIDDQSTDETINIAQSFSLKDNRIKTFINSENKGANYSRNFGLKQSVGKYIIFLDADDILKNDCLVKRVNKIENTELDFCVFSMGTFYKKIGDSNFIWSPVSKEPLNDFLNHKLPWSILQPIWKKTFLIEIGGFDEEFKRLQDVELHTRALLFSKVRFKQYIVVPDCYYRIDEERKNFNTIQFLERRIESSLNYYFKFYPLALALNIDKKLLGTIYKTYLQLLFNYKLKKISKQDFQLLKSKLFNQNLLTGLNTKSKVCFSLAHFFNLLPFRVPGVNFTLNAFLIL